MSRWCRSTIRILDRRGDGLPSGLRSRPLATKVRAGPIYTVDAHTRQNNTTDLASHCINLVIPPESPPTAPIGNQRRQVPLTRHSRLARVDPVPSAPSSDFASTLCTVASAESEQVSHALIHIPVPGNVEHCAGSAVQSEALTTLGAFLTPTRRPSTMTIESLESLYHSLKQRRELQCLTSGQLTKLLSLFGTMSLPRSKQCSVYDSARVRYIDGLSGEIDRWSVVLEIAETKEKLGHALGDGDRYWIMRARIADANGTVASRPGNSWLEKVEKATAQYRIISRSASDPEVHIPYFDTLLSRPEFPHTEQVVDALCHVLEVQFNPHPRFPEFLFTFLLKHGHQLPSILKERIFRMVSNRLSKPLYPGPRTGSSSFQDTRRPGQNAAPPAAIGIAQLSSALGAALFPCYSPRFPVSFVARWARKEARSAFAPDVDLNVRWSNLILLAVCNLPYVSVESRTKPTDLLSDGAFIDWQTVLLLRTLENTLDDTGLSPTRLSCHAQGIARPLWRMWKQLENERRPVDITRVLIACFLRICARAADGPLTDGCVRYCVKHGLWDCRDDNTDAMKLQVQDLIVAYALASVACRSASWSEIFSMLGDSDVKQKAAVMEALLRYYIPRDFEMAYSLYLFNKSSQLTLSSQILLALSKSLAVGYRWKLLAPFFSDPRLSRNQVEELLGTVLHNFQIQRREYADPAITALLGDVMWRLYAKLPPSANFKFPIRFFFSIMITSQHPSKVVDIIEAIYQTTPTFFTVRFFLRILRALLRRQEPLLAVRLFRLISHEETSSRSMGDIRRKLTLGLATTGSHNLARSVYRTDILHGSLRTSRERLVSTVDFRARSPARHLVGDILSIAKHAEMDGPSVRYAVSLLIKARRTLAARKLFERTFRYMDAETRTAIGNILLHGPLHRQDERNGRLVRHVLRTKDFLMKHYEFVPDRTTINIILKSLLKWRNFMDSPKLKVLFDSMIREGYPASERWRGQHGVPFGTPPTSSSQTFGMSSLPLYISFEKHARPMYKMFIKAFHVRGDVHATRTVIGIMREEEVVAVREREKRNRARRLGIIKKKMRAAGQRENGK